ncbi:hypothetical protein QFC22_006088 [Naganishia vaughanmartiniae]|uniref:Uncharacterized protein n=1 Tax=Naganishia vaughanmartiniae TaxID=1424756 RepID=A0ACC2WQ10_9TREE|nr:hypothetical protein QFC22_006088 [Naganishia vaughanmartiniae]
MTVGSSRVADQTVISEKEREQLKDIDRDHQASKPANTIKAYKVPQEEWHKWCLARAIERGEKPLSDLSEADHALAITRRVQMTGTLVAIYLKNEVIDRRYKRRGRVGQPKDAGKRADQRNAEDMDVNDDEDGENESGGEQRVVGPSVVKNTIDALVETFALLSVKHPDHYLFRYSLFETDLHNAYAERVVTANDTTESPMSIQLERVMPDMVRHVDVGRELIVTKIGDMQSTFSQDIGTLAKGLDQLVELMATGRWKDQAVIGKALEK